MNQAWRAKRPGWLWALSLFATAGCAIQRPLQTAQRANPPSHVQIAPVADSRCQPQKPDVSIRLTSLQSADGKPSDGGTAPAASSRNPASPAPKSGVVPAVLSEAALQSAAPDSKPLPPKPKPTGFTLDRVINTTLLADPKLRAGFQAVAQAQGDAVTASLKPNPDLYVDTQLLPLIRPFTPQKQGGPPQTDVYLSYPIDWFLFGKRAAAMQAAVLGTRVSEAEFAELVRQRVLEAATAYYDLLEAKALASTVRQVVDNLQQVEDITRKAVERKIKAKVDLDRIHLNLLNSQLELRNAENKQVAARARLLSIMGQQADDSHFDVAGTLDDELSVKLLSVDGAINLAQENRPDIQSLRWKVYAARADAESEERKKYPAVTPMLGYTHQYQHSIGFPDADTYLVAVTTSLPFFNQNQGNRFKAQSAAVQSEFRLQAAMVALRAEIVEATKQLETTYANSRAIAEDQLKVAKNVREILNKAYQAGERPLIDVLNAQENYLQTYQLYITMRANLSRAEVRYSAILGRSLAPDTKQP